MTAGKAQQLLQASTNFLASLSKTFFFDSQIMDSTIEDLETCFFHLTEKLTIRNPKPNYHGPIGIGHWNLVKIQGNLHHISKNLI